MIEVRYQGRLGNNLFQYSLGRILAEGLGFALEAQPIPGFPHTGDKVAGSRFEGPTEVISGQRIDLAAILANRTPRKIILDGWFQCHSYYRPYREQILQWLAFDPAIRAPALRPQVVVNVRRTDYVWRGWALPYSFYERALRQLLPHGGGDVWIVTDDRADPFFRQFSSWKPKFFNGHALEQMLFMTRAAHLIMSQSTFSWWATFLGDIDVVVCPLPSFGVWSAEGEGADTDLMERDRFVCLECHERYVPSASERRYEDRRQFKRRVIFKLNRTFRLGLEVPPP